MAARNAMSWLGLAVTFGLGLPLMTGYGLLLGKFLPQLYAAQAPGLIPTGSAHLAASMFAGLLLSIGLANKDLNRLDGDMEWLLTLPASIPVLHTMKLAERSLINASGWLVIYPLLLAMCTRGAFSWLAAAAALFMSLPLLLLVALGHVLVESAARVWLPKVVINNLQFAALVSGMALLLLIPSRPQWVAPLAHLPLPAVAQAVSLAFSENAPSQASTFWRLARYSGETAALLGAGFFVLGRIAARGAVVGAGSAQGRRDAHASVSFARGCTRGVVGKELIQLVRDKRALHLALVLPSTLVVPLLLLARGRTGERLFSSSTHLPALAFLGGSMAVLCVSSLLHAEGKALWLLFTLPRSLTRMLAERALVWVPVCLAYAALVLAYGLLHQPLSSELVFGALYCFFGVAVATFIGAGLGLNMVDPIALENEQSSTRGSPALLLLCALLAAFGAGFYADPWLRVSLCVLLLAAAYGVWQDVSLRLPFLLEPDLRPAPRIGVSDGLVCVILILLLQVFGVPLAMSRLQLGVWPARALTFVVVIAIVGAGATFLFRRRGLHDLAASLGVSWGAGAPIALRQGLAWAAPAVLVALLAAWALRYWPWLHDVSQQVAQAQPAVARPSDWLVLIFLTCLAVPLCEELLFRGMIYRALRESLSPRVSALFTAAVFTAIHQSTGFVPVFVLSLLATASFERSRSLVSPVVVHVAYNAALLLASVLLNA